MYYKSAARWRALSTTYRVHYLFRKLIEWFVFQFKRGLCPCSSARLAMNHELSRIRHRPRTLSSPSLHPNPLARKSSQRAVENSHSRSRFSIRAPSSSAPDSVHQSTTTSQSLRSVPRSAATEYTLAARRGRHELAFVSRYRNAY